MGTEQGRAAAPTVFISYSHKDEDWKDRLVTHLGVLHEQGIIDLWDDRRIEGGQDWQPEIEAAMARASVAVLLVTPNLLTSMFILSQEVPRLLQRRHQEGVRVLPVIAKPCAWQHVPWLARMELRPKDARPLSGGTEHQIDTDLAAVANEIAAIIQRAGPPTQGKFAPLSPDKVSLAKLPSTSPDLFGREAELAALDAAWDDEHTHVLTLVAWGGVGKTALVNKWLTNMERDNYRGAQRVFGWSFYSQGAAEGRQVSADPFIAAALAWFGDADPTAGSPWDKGQRLADLVKAQRTLLILDGLEPLQNPPPVETGHIEDPALRCLLRELARQNPGLLVITTRLAVDDLKDSLGSSVQQMDLEDLSPEAGAAYLGHLGVKGSHDELKRAADEFGGHALALTLLGTYLATVYHGDVRQRDKIERVTDEKGQGPHARRMLAAYERWFKGKPELDILRLMGLFDRPAEAGAMQVLRQEPAIAGLTDHVVGLPDADWQYAVQDLRDVRLLAAADPHDPGTLDCHPLLREYFGEQVRTGQPEAWREAHSRLYEYYKSSAKQYPDTLGEMAPLFAAVAHGCQAGRHQEAEWDVYWQRISRREDFFSTQKLGAFGADLAALSGFFDPPWRTPVAGLREASQAFVLNEAALCLRALGRLVEAAQPMQAGLEMRLAQKDWKNAAIGASNLSELWLTLGDIARALEYAQQSVDLADRSGDAFERMSDETTLADAQHQAGQVAEAAALFRQAEEMQKERQPQSPLLYSLWGFRYNDLLLSQGEWRQVLERAEKALEIVQQGSRNLLDIALDHLALGRAHGQQAQAEGTGDYAQAASHLERAVQGLRQAGQQQELPRGLLARAELQRVRGEWDAARHDLEEALEIATRGGMRLHQADCHLEYARLHLACGEEGAARASLAQARKLVQETGYHRRDAELAQLEALSSE
jgi:tetratricopeptide (TPR) repeat protein